MSASDAQSVANIFPSGISLAGGIPIKSQDLAASAIFLVVYVLVVPLAAWRSFAPASRSLTLLRPTIFVLVRIVTWILRIVMSTGHYSAGLFIAEQILLLTGFVMLCEPLVSLLACHISRNQRPSPDKSFGLHNIVRFLRLVLLAAIVLGIYAGSQYSNLTNSDGSTNTSTLNTVKSCRDANAIICLAITALVCLIAVFAQLREQLPIAQTGYLVLCGALLTIGSVYKIVLYEASAPNPIHPGTKAAFYCLNALPEFLVTVLFFIPNVKVWFAIAESDERERVSKLMKKGEYDGEGMYDQNGYLKENHQMTPKSQV